MPLNDETRLERDPGSETPSPAGVPDELVETEVWSDELIARHGLSVEDVPLVSIGGGLGSLAMLDTLRIAGVPAAQLRTVTDLDSPEETYRLLAENSQIPPHERLRSDSQSVMDNIWGFPSYAIREAWRKKSFQPAWQVMSEPILSEFFTPQAGQVYESVHREAARIGWPTMRRDGYARLVRRRVGGGYFTLISSGALGERSRTVTRSRFVHLAVGYLGIRLLRDLQEYRERSGDYRSVVNAYESHDHVYETALFRPTTVVVRGSGIVAARVLQRLFDDREKNDAPTRIVHLFRTYVDGPQGDSATFRRPGGRGYAYQGFNFPKASWGGQLRDQLEAASPEERARLIDAFGGTNVPKRGVWQRQMDRGLAEGSYEQRVGEVTNVRNSPGGGLVLEVGGNGNSYEVGADFVIDATGLVADIGQDRLIGDLLEHGGARRNPKGRLDVGNDFSVLGAESAPGKLYASGSITLGGPYAGVDSFLGLQYAALAIADDLAAEGFCRKIGPGRSLSQWWRWVRGRSPD